MKHGLILGVGLVLLGVIAGPLLAAGTSEVRSLAGVKALRVVVEDLNPAMQKTGLRKEQLQAVAEQQLVKSGLTVLQPQERTTVPMVYIRLSSVIGGNSKSAPISFYLIVQVKQLALLAPGVRLAFQTVEAPAAAPLLVTTWENGTMVMLDRSELFFYVGQTLTNLLGDLVHDYQQANKK